MTEAFWHTIDYLKQGGFIMVPLVVVSFVMWTLIVDRFRVFAELRRNDLNQNQAIALVSGQPQEGPTGRGMKTRLVAGFLRERSGSPRLDREILGSISREMKQDLDDRLATIAVLAGIAPLLGLLGTVLGMIETFEVISVFGTGNSRAMASGISVALVTTQSGLLVAIPGLLMSNRLGGAASRLKTNLDETTAVLARHIAEERPQS